MLKAHYKFIVVKPIEEGQIKMAIDPDSIEAQLRLGEILSVGSKVENLKKGEKVIFNAIGGGTFKYNYKGQEIYFVNYETIFVTL